MPPKAKKTNKTSRAAKTAKPRKKPTDSEEEWDAKPTRKIARKKKKVEKWYGRYTYEELGPYYAKYDAICDNFKDYCKVQKLVEWERWRDLEKAREDQQRAEHERLVKEEDGGTKPVSVTSSASCPSPCYSGGTISADCSAWE